MALIEACASVEAVIERARSLFADTDAGVEQLAMGSAARLDQIAATTRAITEVAAAVPGGAGQRVVLSALKAQMELVQQVVGHLAQPADARDGGSVQ